MRVILALLAAVALSAAGCPGKKAAPPGKHVLGSEGRERWIVAFDGGDGDLGAYRELLKDGDDDKADAFAEKARAKLKQAHSDVEGQVVALGGQVVEVWWMSNAITVEIEPGKVESLRALVGKLGVKSVTPDVPLGG